MKKLNSDNWPVYQCHKRVKAHKIKEVDPYRFEITFEGEGVPALPFDQDFMNKHKPQAGGYVVIYDDSYVSYSPPKAFEDGYTLIGQVGAAAMIKTRVLKKLSDAGDFGAYAKVFDKEEIVMLNMLTITGEVVLLEHYLKAGPAYWLVGNTPPQE